MSRTLFLSSPQPLDPMMIEGADVLSPYVLSITPAQEFAGEGIDANVLDADHPRPKLFLADMDSTMIGQECIDELADYAGVKTEVAEVTERAMQGELDFADALRARVALLKGLPESVLERCYEERIVPNPGAVELLETLGDAGAHRVLVSGGFTFFAERIAKRLGFDAFHANVLGVHDGALTGEVEGEIVGADVKAKVLKSEVARLGIDARQSLAIGDGANDLPMIEAAGLGVAYRAKPKLREKADIHLDHSHLDSLKYILKL